MSAQGTQIGQLSSSLEAFGLKHAAKALPDQLEIAERNELSSRQFLASLLAVESDGRFARKRKRNYASAHFPPNVRPIDEFDCSELEGGITPSQIEELKELAWLDAHGNIVLAGPPGLGKTMLALGLGLQAIDSGYTVAYEKMESLVSVLDDASIDRKAVGYTPITKIQASRFFSFVSDAYERSSLVFTTNKEITQWDELMNDQTLTTAMLDRVLHHARCFSLRGESYRLKHPEVFALPVPGPSPEAE